MKIINLKGSKSIDCSINVAIGASPSSYYRIDVQGRTGSIVPTAGTLLFSATQDVEVVSTGSVVIQSITRSTEGGMRNHQIVINCPNDENGSIIIYNAVKIRSLSGYLWGNIYSGDQNTAPIISLNISQLNDYVERINQTAINNACKIFCNNKLPYLLQRLGLSGNENNFNYTGALPSGLTYLLLNGSNINWSYTGALPPMLTYLLLSGSNINWTGNILGNLSTPKPNMTYFLLNDYRIPSNTMSYTDLESILDSIINYVGNLPSTVTINEQIPSNVTAIINATPNENGSEPERCKYKINWIKSNKNVTTFKLNDTNI